MALTQRDRFLNGIRARYVNVVDLLESYKAGASEARHWRRTSLPYSSTQSTPLSSAAADGLPLDRLVSVLQPIAPRYYSVSSPASALRPSSADLTFRLVQASSAPPGGGVERVWHGLCSSYLSTRKPGDVVQLAVRFWRGDLRH